MKEQFNETLSVQRAVKDVMEKNISKWQGVPAFKSQYDKYVLNLKKIEDYLIVLGQDLIPLKEKRKLAKEQLIERVFPISSALSVYASDMGDRKLAKLLIGKLRDIKKLSSSDLLKYAKRILETTGTMMGKTHKKGKNGAIHPIGDYGLTESVLLKLQDAVDNFESVINEYIDTTLNRKKCRVKLAKRISENEVLLNKKMDRMIHLFRDNQKAFYTAYLKSRLYIPPVSGEDEKPDEKGKEAAPEKKVTAAAVKPTSASAKPTSAKPTSAKPASAKPASAKAAPVKPAPAKKASDKTSSGPGQKA
jgi:hypothetical protein